MVGQTRYAASGGVEYFISSESPDEVRRLTADQKRIKRTATFINLLDFVATKLPLTLNLSTLIRPERGEG